MVPRVDVKVFDENIRTTVQVPSSSSKLFICLFDSSNHREYVFCVYIL